MRLHDSFCLFLIASTLGHVVGISSIGVALDGHTLRHLEPTQVAFLGELLGSVSPGEYTSTMSVITDEWRTDPHADWRIQTLTHKRPIEDERILTEGADKPMYAHRSGLENKQNPPNHTDALPRQKSLRYQPGITIRGAAASCDVLYMPPIPALPRWADAIGKNFSARYSFSVTNTGLVEAVYLDHSSGYPDIDAIGLRYLKRWRFVPQTGGSRADGRPLRGLVQLHFIR